MKIEHKYSCSNFILVMVIVWSSWTAWGDPGEEFIHAFDERKDAVAQQQNVGPQNPIAQQTFPSFRKSLLSLASQPKFLDFSAKLTRGEFDKLEEISAILKNPGRGNMSDTEANRITDALKAFGLFDSKGHKVANAPLERQVIDLIQKITVQASTPKNKDIGALTLKGQTVLGQPIEKQFGALTVTASAAGGTAMPKVELGSTPIVGGAATVAKPYEEGALGSFSFNSPDDYKYNSGPTVPTQIRKYTPGESGSSSSDGDDYASSPTGGGNNGNSPNTQVNNQKKPSLFDQILPSTIDKKGKKPGVFGVLDISKLCTTEFRNPYCPKKKRKWKLSSVF